jgi:hypothetical protein
MVQSIDKSASTKTFNNGYPDIYDNDGTNYDDVNNDNDNNYNDDDGDSRKIIEQKNITTGLCEMIKKIGKGTSNNCTSSPTSPSATVRRNDNIGIEKDYVKVDRNDDKESPKKHFTITDNKSSIRNDYDNNTVNIIDDDMHDDINESDDENEDENNSYLIQIYKEIKENENRIMKFEDDRRKQIYANLKMNKQ